MESGTKLGQYAILSALGKGSMDEVYQAWDTRLDRTVAIKVPSADVPAEPRLRQSFERSSRAREV